MRPNKIFTLLIIIINKQLSLQLDNSNKCCENGIDQLKNETFLCNDIRKSDRLRINLVFEENVNKTECVDIFDDKVAIFEKNNESFVKIGDVEALTKCCPLDYVYNATRKSCEKLSPNKLNIFNDELIKIGLPLCQIISDLTSENLTEITFNSSSLYLPKSDEFFTENQFCLDQTVDGKYVVRLCRDWSVCDYMKCIKKCCADGKSFVNGSNCQDTFVHGLEFNGFESFIGDIKGDFAVVHGNPGQGKVYVEPKVSKFFLDEIGKFHNTKTNEIHLHPSQPYCIEHALKEGIVNKHAYFGFFINQSPPLETKFLWNRAAMIVSSGFLIFTIFFYIISGETKKIFGKSLVCFCFSLLALYILLVYHTFHANLHLSKTKGLCKTLGFTIICLGFSSFMWLQIMCYDINSTFGKTCRYLDKNEKQRRDFKKFLFYSLYAWGVPLLYTIIMTIFHLTDSLPYTIRIRLGKTKCGIEKGNYSEILFRAVPLTAVQFANSIYFFKTVTYILQVKKEIKQMVETPITLKKKRKFFARRQRFGLILKLSLTMGVFYLFEVISSFFDFSEYKATAIVEIIWDFINCLQGLFIFLIFVCKRKNYDKLKKSNAMERIRKISLTTSVKTTLTTLPSANVNNFS